MPAKGQIVPNNTRFLEIYNKLQNQYNENDCYIWPKYCDTIGYGKFWDCDKRKMVYAHRFCYEFFCETINDSEKFVMHRCDNPSCINLTHLKLGNPKENSLDKAKKKRTKGFPTLKGEKHTQAKFSDKEILEMRKLYDSGISINYIRDKFEISLSHLKRIINKKVRINV